MVNDDGRGPDATANALHFRSWERQLRAARRADLTITTYWTAFNDLTGYHSGRDVAALAQADMEDYFVAALQELSATTVRIRFKALRAFFNWAVREEIIERSPMARLSEPSITDEAPEVLSDDDLKTLLKACEGKEFADRRDTAIIRLFCEPGSPRLREMTSIAMDDLDMKNDAVRLRGKGDKIRVVPFGTKTGVAVDRYLRVRARHKFASSKTLWLGSRGTGGMTISGIGQMLTRRAREAGIGHVHPHQLRHTAAHVFADSGGAEGDAMELFGWSSAEMPRRYGRSAKTARAHRAARRMSLGDRL